MDGRYVQCKPKKYQRKGKDRGSRTITITIATTMTMTEIIGPQAETDHETTTEMTIGKKIIGDPESEA